MQDSKDAYITHGMASPSKRSSQPPSPDLPVGSHCVISVCHPVDAYGIESSGQLLCNEHHYQRDG